MIAGRWTFRCFKDSAALVGRDAAAALAMIVDEGVFDLRGAGAEAFEGTLGRENGEAMRLSVRTDPDGAVSIRATGIVGTASAGRSDDYRGIAGHAWPDAAGQRPSLVGTVRRSGYGAGTPEAASFIAWLQPEETKPRTNRHGILRNALTAG